MKTIQIHRRIDSQMKQPKRYQRDNPRLSKPNRHDTPQFQKLRRVRQYHQRSFVSKDPFGIEESTVQGVVLDDAIQGRTVTPTGSDPFEAATGEHDQTELNLHQAEWPHGPG
mmetsp:Transcript_109685/g.163987  ORF Transcript_109685/g.163987 Transcript_109685/m.163987 type:complete len:112 (-) Transcript_109685:22-357(-)